MAERKKRFQPGFAGEKQQISMNTQKPDVIKKLI